MERGDLLELATRLGTNLQTLSEEKVRDLLGRARVADIDGFAEIAATEKKKAYQLIRAYTEKASGVQERKALRTPDARKLARDILLLFSEQASSKLAKNRFSLLAPALDRETIQNRLGACLTGTDILRELKQRGKRDELGEVLGEVSFDTASGGKKPSSRTESDTLDYFMSRRRIIKAAHSILTSFDEVRTLSSFFKSADRNVLENIMKTLEEYESKEVQDAEAVLSDAEILINEELRKGGVDKEGARRIVEERIEGAVSALRMNSEEENEVRRAALEGLSIPFEFGRTGRRRVIEKWEGRQKEERAAKLAKTESFLKQYWAVVDDAVERVISLDQILAMASLMEKYSLTIPVIGNEGIAFVNGRSLFLMKDQLEGGSRAVVQPVSYALGRTRSTKMVVAKHRNVVMLTGANSGGKTTLLTTLASIHILTLFGLPVPCERAEVAPIPIYLFRRRVTRKIGSLEQALSSLIPVFADRHRKLVLMDEFEALTEPGAAGRILAGIMNAVATSSSLLLLVTHLARETLPHVKLPIRVDGIEAEGLDKDGELIVDRQPKFNHIGSSTPKLIIMKLSKAAKKNDKALYGDILNSLEGESSIPVQTPLNLPWLSKEDA